MNPRHPWQACKQIIQLKKLSITGSFFFVPLPKQLAMRFFRSPKQKNLQEINYLSLTPTAILGHETTQNGLVSLHVPRFQSKLLPKFITIGYENRPILLKLDKLGSATWLLIDGSNTVGLIIQTLETRFGAEITPADERVTKFLSQLYRDKFIKFLEIQ